MTKTTCSSLTQEIFILSQKKILCTDWIDYCIREHEEILPFNISHTGRRWISIANDCLQDVHVDDAITLHFASIRSALLGHYQHVSIPRAAMKGLAAIMDYAVSRGICKVNPVTEDLLIFKENNSRENLKIKRLSDIQMEQLEVLIQSSDNTAALYMATTIGLNPSILRALNWRDMDFVSGELHITHKLTRSDKPDEKIVMLPAKKQRTIHLPEYLISELCAENDRLMRIRKNRTGYNPENYMFINQQGNHISQYDLRSEIKIIGQAIGVPDLCYKDLQNNAVYFAIKHGVHIKDIMSYYGAVDKNREIAEIYKQLRQEACREQ